LHRKLAGRRQYESKQPVVAAAAAVATAARFEALYQPVEDG